MSRERTLVLVALATVLPLALGACSGSSAVVRPAPATASTSATASSPGTAATPATASSPATASPSAVAAAGARPSRPGTSAPSHAPSRRPVEPAYPQAGASGPEVVAIQERLRVHGAVIEVDGKFGPSTTTALRAFQRRHALADDGVAGPRTMAALAAKPAARDEAPADPGAGTDGTDEAGDTAPSTVLGIVNAQRTSAGCSAVRSDSRLTKAAVLHAKDMVGHDYFSHVSLDGRSFVDRAEAQGYPAPGGENIAAGQTSARAVMDAWLGSKGHRANILNCDFRAMGVGRVANTWVQVFGFK